MPPAWESIWHALALRATSCPPKRPTAFSVCLVSGAAHIAEIMIAKREQFVAHADTSSPLCDDLMHAERSTLGVSYERPDRKFSPYQHGHLNLLLH